MGLVFGGVRFLWRSFPVCCRRPSCAFGGVLSGTTHAGRFPVCAAPAARSLSHASVGRGCAKRVPRFVFDGVVIGISVMRVIWALGGVPRRVQVGGTACGPTPPAAPCSYQPPCTRRLRQSPEDMGEAWQSGKASGVPALRETLVSAFLERRRCLAPCTARLTANAVQRPPHSRTMAAVNERCPWALACLRVDRYLRSCWPHTCLQRGSCNARRCSVI